MIDLSFGPMASTPLPPGVCGECGGEGQVQSVDGNDEPTVAVCPICKGSGRDPQLEVADGGSQ